MFENLFPLRIRAAESALREGRLEEALRLAGAADVRSHRRGAEVLRGLGERFLERARTHFREERFTEALLDLDRAECGGELTKEISELRQHVKTVKAEFDRRSVAQRALQKEVKDRVERGSLAAGRRALKWVDPEDSAVHSLGGEIERRAGEVKHEISVIEELIQAGQWAVARERLCRAKTLDAHDEGVIRLEGRICQDILAKARSAVAEGRMKRASDELGCLGSLGQSLPEKREVKQWLSLAESAARQIQVRAWAEAESTLLSLGRLTGNPPWIGLSIEHVRRVREAEGALGGGPLGELGTLIGGTVGPRRSFDHSSLVRDETVDLRTLGREGADRRLLLLVDGGGSFLLIRGAEATIGRAVSEDPADIGLNADLPSKHARVVRSDEDYFLVADRPVEVEGRTTQYQLLRHGDRCVLGRRAKLTFRKPSRTSASAVLELSDTTKMAHDVRQVVLFDGHATIGSDRSAHIRCRHAGVPLILFERAGAMWVRPRNDGHVDASARPLPLGATVDVSGVRMVLKPYGDSASGTAVKQG